VRILLITNDARALKPEQATTLLGFGASERGWQTWVGDARELYVDGAQGVCVRARQVPRSADVSRWQKQLAAAPLTAVALGQVDAVLVRTNPGRGTGTDHDTAIAMLAMAEHNGVRVHNSPRALMTWRGKLSQALVPKRYRPPWRAGLASGAVDAFLLGREGRSVVKPLVGTQGRGVVRLEHQDGSRGGVMDGMLQGGGIIAQDYLEEAPAGDIRIIVIEGQVLRAKGRVAAVGRRPPKGDFRSNVAAGGTAWFPDTVPPDALRAATATAKNLAAAGLLVAGVDIVGGQVVEVNLASPGGFHDIHSHTGIDVAGAVLDAVEGKA